MAVYCGVCAIQLYDATENYGAFQSDDFGGWDQNSPEGIGATRIGHTCSDCAAVLRRAVADAARILRESNLDRVVGLRERIRVENERARAFKDGRDKAIQEFEARWRREGR